MLDTANMSTKVFEDVGWLNQARFFKGIKFIVAFFINCFYIVLKTVFKH